jgi:hypothetical protein
VRGDLLLVLGVDLGEDDVVMVLETFSNTGAKVRQGPHQGAQKSTMTKGCR